MTRRALIVGCSSGIGLAATRALLADGWLVYGAARTTPLLTAPGFRFMNADVAELASVEALRDWLLGELDGNPLDAVIHAAAIQQPVGALEETDPVAWAHAIQVGLIGPYHVVRSVLPALHRAADARVLLFAGGGAFSPRPHFSAYACAKAGVVRLAETLAEELTGTSVAVNCIAPGFVPTPIHHATLEAGPLLAGAEFDRVIRDVARDDGSRMARVVGCIRHLLSPASRGLAGKTVAAQFDPWEEINPATVPGLMATDLWSARRVNQPAEATPTEATRRVARQRLARACQPLEAHRGLRAARRPRGAVAEPS